jgi:hypothetical protein
MAFYRPQDTGLIEPRDPSAIDERSRYGSILSLVILLLIGAVAFGLYFLYADSSATPSNAAPPPAAQVSPSPAPAPSPATQPPTQTPTP